MLNLVSDKNQGSPRYLDVEKSEDYWSIEEAAQYLGYTPRWLRELARKGKFYPFKVGKKWLFKKSLIDQYVSETNGR